MQKRRTLMVLMRARYVHLWCSFGMERQPCPVKVQLAIC